MKYPNWLRDWAEDISPLEVVGFAAFLVVLLYKVYKNWPLITIVH